LATTQVTVTVSSPCPGMPIDGGAGNRDDEGERGSPLKSPGVVDAPM